MVLVECDWMQFIKLLKERLDRDEFIEAMLVMRSIWIRRNDYVFQGKFTPPSQVILKAKSLVAICAESRQEALFRKNRQWIKPLFGEGLQGVDGLK